MSRGHEWIEDAPAFPGEMAYTRLPTSALLAMAGGIALDRPRRGDAARCCWCRAATTTSSTRRRPTLIAAALGGPVRRVTLEHGGHVATLDADRGRLCTAVETFVATATLRAG